jgi:fluoroacetyl-CoA thioesterase
MRQIPLGAKGSFSLFVQPEHLADRFKDAILPPVFATPVMIMVMENAALNAIRAYLDPGESAVGTAVNVRHIAATPVGRLVTGEAEVTKSTRARSSSPSEQPMAPRRSGPARIPGL